MVQLPGPTQEINPLETTATLSSLEVHSMLPDQALGLTLAAS